MVFPEALHQFAAGLVRGLCGLAFAGKNGQAIQVSKGSLRVLEKEWMSWDSAPSKDVDTLLENGAMLHERAVSEGLCGQQQSQVTVKDWFTSIKR